MIPLESPDSCCEHKRVEFMDLRCKTAIVAGGASGIGFETAAALLEGGVFHVVIADIDRCKASEAVVKLNASFIGNRSSYSVCDIRACHTLDRTFRETIRDCCQVDIFINCVGIFNETPECWEATVTTNLIGTVRGTIMAYHYLSHNKIVDMPKGGAIINVSSWASLSNIPSMPVFSSAASGINGLSASFGQDFHYCRTRVRCIAVCPASTESDVFKDMATMHYDAQWAPHSQTALSNPKSQSPKAVAKAIMHCIKYGLNGSVYAIADGNFFRYVMPNYTELCRQECILF